MKKKNRGRCIFFFMGVRAVVGGREQIWLARRPFGPARCCALIFVDSSGGSEIRRASGSCGLKNRRPKSSTAATPVTHEVRTI